MKKLAFMEAHLSEYMTLTEDSIWSLLAAAAEGRLSSRLVTPADQILRRQVLAHFRIKPGKRELLREALINERLTDNQDFYLLDSETTLYKNKGYEGVFVRDEEGYIEEIPKHSETIAAFRGRSEVEHFLVVLAPDKMDQMKKIAQDGQFIGTSKTLAIGREQLEFDFIRRPASQEQKSGHVSPSESQTA
jgi:hypothetical protein